MLNKIDANKVKDPNTIEVTVADTVGVGESNSDAPKPIKPVEEVIGNTEEGFLKEKEEAIAKLLERQVFLAEKYVAPHSTPGRRVKEEDLPRLIADAAVMHEMCMVGRADYTTAFAIAHTQICNEDPLRFFVTLKGEIYINPVLTDKGHEIMQTREGCMSYPSEPMTGLIRFKKVTLKYRTLAQKSSASTGEALAEPYLTNEITAEFDGQMAQILQHECQHLNGSDIYKDKGGGSKAFYEPKIDKP